MHCPLSIKLHCKNLQSVVAAHAMGEMGDDTSSDVFESAAADKDNDIYIHHSAVGWGRAREREGGSCVCGVFVAALLCGACVDVHLFAVLCFALPLLYSVSLRFIYLCALNCFARLNLTMPGSGNDF